MKILLSCTLITWVASLTVFADSITLSGGRTVVGTIIQTNASGLVLLTDHGTLSYPQAIIEHVSQEAEPDKLGKDRIPDANSLIRFLGKQPWATNLQQIPATVIDKGSLKYVPYISFRCANDYEINIYGDPSHPAGIEAGVYRKLLQDEPAKNNCLNLISAVLGNAADKKTLTSLNREQDLKANDGLTFEITPPFAEDAYEGWWISVFSEKELNQSRASDAELKQITVSKSGAAKDGQPDSWTDKEMQLARSSGRDKITFTNSSGNLITDAEVVRVNDGVSLVWRKGASGGVVKLRDLPPSLQTRYGYDPKKTEVAEAAEQDKRARDAQLAQAQAQAAAQSTGAVPDPPSYQSSDYSGSYSSGGSVYVRGYSRKDGTYVQPYTRSAPHRK